MQTRHHKRATLHNFFWISKNKINNENETTSGYFSAKETCVIIANHVQSAFSFNFSTAGHGSPFTSRWKPPVTSPLSRPWFGMPRLGNTYTLLWWTLQTVVPSALQDMCTGGSTGGSGIVTL